MPVAQIIQRFGMGRKAHAIRQLQIKNQNIQLPPGSNSGIQLAQGAGSGISGICKQRLPRSLSLFVESLKNLLGHKYLSPYNEPRRSILQGERDGTNGLQIFCHILPDPTVAPRRSPDKFTIYVFQRHR